MDLGIPYGLWPYFFPETIPFIDLPFIPLIIYSIRIPFIFYNRPIPNLPSPRPSSCCCCRQASLMHVTPLAPLPENTGSGANAKPLVRMRSSMGILWCIACIAIAVEKHMVMFIYLKRHMVYLLLSMSGTWNMERVAIDHIDT